jgi:hypothetical protein
VWLTLCFPFRLVAQTRFRLARGVAFRDFVAKRVGGLLQNAKILGLGFLWLLCWRAADG